MNGKRWAVVLSMGILLCASAGVPVLAADADQRYLYQWTDGQGNVGIADDLTKVPPEFRSRATRLQQPGAAEPDSRSRGAEYQAQAEGQEAGTAASDDDLKKAEWQQRMADAKRQQAAAEARTMQIEQRKGELKAKWGASAAALPPQEAMDEMARLESELTAAQKEADRARNQVDVVIPEEARRAGIPPGWLREVR